MLEKPALTDADRALIEKLIDSMASAARESRRVAETAGERLKAVLQEASVRYFDYCNRAAELSVKRLADDLEKASVKKLFEKLNGLAIVPVANVKTGGNYAQTMRAPQDLRTLRPQAPKPQALGLKLAGSGEGDASVGKSGLRRMLIALAQRNGLSRAQLGMRAGVSSKGGSFDTYVSKGRVNGWITGTNGRFEITEAGVMALGHYEPLPTGQALLEHYLRELGTGGSGRMLRALADAYPNTMTRDELGAAANVSPAGGSFDTYVSKLRTMELLQGERNAFQASAEFVEE